MSESNVGLTFQPRSADVPQCDILQLINDDILESDENFRIILSTSDSAVVINPDTTLVTINNDDCKLHLKFIVPTYSDHSFTSFDGLDLFSCVVVFTRIEQVEYSVQESRNSVEVCAEVSGRTQIPMSVTLASLDVSATSKQFACAKLIL